MRHHLPWRSKERASGSLLLLAGLVLVGRFTLRRPGLGRTLYRTLYRTLCRTLCRTLGFHRAGRFDGARRLEGARRSRVLG
jgi:hypothetical protein